MYSTFRRPSFRPYVLYSFLLLALFAIVAGVTGPLPKSSAYFPRVSSNATEDFTTATVPIMSGNSLQPATAAKVAKKIQLRESFGKLPLRFEANRGQSDARVRFLARGLGYGLFLTPDEAVLVLQRDRRFAPRQAVTRNDVIRMKLIGADPDPAVDGINQLPGTSNYFIGNNSSDWRSEVPAFASVRYGSVYPGVDLFYYGNQQEVEYDYNLAPGADPSVIRVKFEGARARLEKSGDLILRTRTGTEVRQRKPFAYQEIDGERRAVEARFVLLGQNSFGFEVAAYDASKPLVIDPSLVYSTYVGGASPVNGNDQAFGIAIDIQGNAYITGQTASTTFPVTPGAYRTTPDTGVSSGDAFVAKLNPTGTALIYATYLGGISPFGNSATDTGYGIAVDAQGNAYVAGHTFGNFPTTPGAAQTAPPSATDKGFITKLNPTGTALVYSSYIGGNNYNFAFAVTIDGAGNAYVAGTTGATNFPVTPGAFQTSISSTTNADAFVVKLNPSGSAYVYATYLGGTLSEDASGIALDAGGRAYVTGVTYSTNFPVTPTAYQTTYQSTNPFFFAQGDAFLTVLDAAGASTPYSTYLGGAGEDLGLDVAVDVLGNAYVSGSTLSSNFPTTPGAFQTSYHFNTDAFVTKVNPAAAGAASVPYSTYLGGARLDRADGVALDPLGNVYVAGGTASDDFPVTACAAQTTASGGSVGLPKDVFLTKLNMLAPGNAGLIYSTYLGGNDFETARDVAVDATGNAFVAGPTRSTDFPTTPGAFQTTLQQSPQPQDAFVAKFDPNACVLACPNDPANDADGDGVCGDVDNCPTTANPDQADADGDGVGDACETCPNDPNKTAPGVCGCGVADTDSDGDGTPDCNDQCPNDPNKTAPGVCGCSVADTDSDGDGTPDCNDQCPNDPNKAGPGVCGCGVADIDTDGDGTPNCNDACPNDPNKIAPGVCGCGVTDLDSDGDGIANCNDNCPNDPNKVAPGACGCGVPDTDTDGDGAADCNDACPSDPNKIVPGACGCGVADTDTDGDGTPNCNDACPNDPNKVAPGVCGCGVPDADSDGDGIPGCQDNCPTVFNPDQRDTNGDGVGDVCTPFQFPQGGQFVIGNLVDITGGATVNFWGSQWAMNNPMSGGAGPNAFKGFENVTAQPACGGTWTSQPGNSSDPPQTIPQYMAIIVSSSIQKNGPVINGDIERIVVVQTNPGYDPSPGHRGTGQVVAILCETGPSASLFYRFLNSEGPLVFKPGLEWLERWRVRV
jgi:hypothetical protein